MAGYRAPHAQAVVSKFVSALVAEYAPARISGSLIQFCALLCLAAKPRFVGSRAAVSELEGAVTCAGPCRESI